MAFYSARVDKNGKEIERRQSTRSVTDMSSASSCWSGYSSTETSKSSSIKYINSAAYIEKTSDDCSDVCSIESDGTNLSASSSSVYQILSDDACSNIVPPLDLMSESSFRTKIISQRDYYPYHSQTEKAQLVLKPHVAYTTWLSAKKKLISQDVQRRKKMNEEKREQQDARAQIAKEKFQQWLDLKSRQQTRSREQLKSAPNKYHLTAKESQEKIAKWERTKQKEMERRRIMKQQEEKRRIEMEERRREMSARAWENWMNDAKNKPKPVPLNQGIFTLRGTVSDIFVNPNEWVNIAPINEE